MTVKVVSFVNALAQNFLDVLRRVRNELLFAEVVSRETELRVLIQVVVMPVALEADAVVMTSAAVIFSCLSLMQLVL